MTDLNWRKSSRSQQNGQCVELASRGRAVRDSKNPDGPQVWVSLAAAISFIEAAKSGQFDS